jgi:hypothetical protein
MFDEIRNSFPAISDQLAEEERVFFDRLPDDYRAFLLAHNGGFVEEFRYTFLTGVPFRTSEIDNPSRDDCPVEFFGIATTEPGSALPEDIMQMVVDHAAEEFLPRDVIAIARCVQSSLVCLSLRADDRGAIYYWDWYWRYPWCKDFFDARIARALAAFDDPDAIRRDLRHPRRAELHDALNFATLVKLAPSFSEWGRSCEDRREPE